MLHSADAQICLMEVKDDDANDMNALITLSMKG